MMVQNNKITIHLGVYHKITTYLGDRITNTGEKITKDPADVITTYTGDNITDREKITDLGDRIQASDI